MTDRHIHYVGPFVHDGSFAEMVVRPDSGLGRPKLRRALKVQEVEDLAARLCPDAAARDRWEMWLEDGLLVVEAIHNDPRQLSFLRALLAEFDCDLVEGTMRVVPAAEAQQLLTPHGATA